MFLNKTRFTKSFSNQNLYDHFSDCHFLNLQLKKNFLNFSFFSVLANLQYLIIVVQKHNSNLIFENANCAFFGFKNFFVSLKPHLTTCLSINSNGFIRMWSWRQTNKNSKRIIFIRRALYFKFTTHGQCMQKQNKPDITQNTDLTF